MKYTRFVSNYLLSVPMGCIATWLLCTSGACGQGLTYLDASHEDFFNDESTPANLFVAPGGSPDGTGAAISGILNDNGIRVNNNGLWDYNGNNGGSNSIPGSASTVYTAGDPASSADPNIPLYEDVPELGMRIPGLAASTNYDVYVVYWGTPTSDWSIRAGLLSNPGANQVFNRLGPTDFAPSAIAGDLATAALWSTKPPVNGNSGTIFADDDRLMYLGLVGTGVSTSGGTLDVFIDDLPTAPLDPNDPGRDTSNRTWFDGIAYVPTGTTPVVTATIDRTTGNISVNNNTGIDLDFDSYSMSSAVGALVPGAWDSIDGGNSTVVETDTWNITDPTGSPSAANLLAEEEDGSGGGSGAKLINTGTFDLGDVWIRNPTEDVSITLNLTNGETLILGASYINGDQAIEGDFDFDGDLDQDDYANLMSNMFSPSVGVTEAEAYTFGDLTDDLVIDFDDHNQFQALFDAANGAGAFQAMVSAVPEPTSATLACFLFTFGAICRRSRQ